MHFRMAGEFLRHILDALLQGAFGRKQQAIGAAQVMDLLARKTAPLQADEIEAGEIGAVARRHAKGNDIFAHRREALDDRLRADADKLVNAAAAAENGVIAYLAMAGEHDVIGEDNVVADLAVMRHMRVGEEGAFVADDCLQAAGLGAGVHGDALADQAVVADGEDGTLTVIFEILRLVADGGEGEDAAARANRRAPGDDSVRDQFDALAQSNLRADMAKRPDAHAGGQLRAVLDNC